jgi:hypothetical protein
MENSSDNVGTEQRDESSNYPSSPGNRSDHIANRNKMHNHEQVTEHKSSTKPEEG